MLGGIALVVLLLKVFLVSSARVTTDAKLSTEAGKSLSSDGELHTETNSSNCDLSRYPQLEGRFENLVYAGKGANGCVVLANDKDNGNVEVAVKLSKKAGKLASWHSECEQSRSLHEKACTAGHEQLLLAERYLPICLEVGGTDDAPFMVMHAAGGKGIGAMRSKLRGEYRVSVFSQMVGALTAMHGIGLSHNDLHDGNVVILSKPGPLVAFIDFGEVETLKNANYGGGYKQDENLLARQAAKLADCPSEAQFPFNSEKTHDHHKQHTRKKALMTCLQDKWGKGEDEASFSVFLRALGAVVDEAYKHELEHGKKHNRNDVTKTCVKTLYHTAFVQEHQPPLWSLFPARLCAESGSGGQAPDHWLPPAEDTDKRLDDCETACNSCPDKTPMYVCRDGKKQGECKRKPWKNNDKRCASVCTCRE